MTAVLTVATLIVVSLAVSAVAGRGVERRERQARQMGRLK